MKRLLFTLSTCIAATVLMAQGGISVTPGKLVFEHLPGEVAAQTITIKNPTEDPLDLAIDFADWKRDSSGVKIYTAPASLSHGCSQWLDVRPKRLYVPPGTEGQIKVTMLTPTDYETSDGVHNTMLFINQTIPYKTEQQSSNGVSTQIDVAFRIGVHIYYAHPELQHRKIVMHELEKVDTRALRVGLENQGNALLSAQIMAELTHLESGQEYSVDASPLTVAFMPSDYRRVPIPLPAELPAGPYSVLVSVDIGKEYDMEVGILEVEITP